MTAKDGLIHSAIGFSARAGSQLCMIGVTLFAIRSLSIADFGAYAIAAAFMFLFRRLFYVGPYEYLLQTPYSKTLAGSCLLANGVFALGSILLLLPICYVSRWIFETPLVGELLLLLAPALLLTMVTSWFEALLLREQRMKHYHIFTVTGEAVGAVAAIWALLAGWGVYALVLQTYGRLAALLCCQLLLRRGHGYSGHDIALTRHIIGWSGSRHATVVVNFFSVYGADIMLGALLTPFATGLFRAASRIVSALTDLFAQPLQKIAQTNLAARKAHGLGIDDSWIGMFSAVGAIGWASLAALACVAHELVPAVLGSHWAPAAPVVVVMCIVRGLPILDATTVSLLVCAERRKDVLRIQLMTAIGVVGGAGLFAGQGVVAVAVALGLVLSAQSATLSWLCCRLSQVETARFLSSLCKALVPALGAMLAVGLYRVLGGPVGRAPFPLGLMLLSAGAGTLIGLLFIRGGLVRSIRLLAPMRPVRT
jgi:O-antigen/teichoic acid export membrane protein